MTSDKEDDGKSAGLHFTSRFSVGAAPDPLPETPAFRALIIGDFGATRDLGRPIRIDEDTIESLPERLGVSLEVETPNLLSSDQHPVVETLTLERLRPDRNRRCTRSLECRPGPGGLRPPSGQPATGARP